MKKNAVVLLLSSLAGMYACGGVSPVINNYEKAGTLKKGNIEVMGNFSSYAITGAGKSEGLNNNFGLRAGYGISNNVDIKLRYEHLKPQPHENEDAPAVHFFSVVPKFALLPDKFSLLVPISFYVAGAGNEEQDQYNMKSIAPQLIYTFTNTKNTLDLSPGLKADWLFAGSGGGLLFGFTLGAGISSNLNKWAIRPEVGMLSLGAGAFVSYGVALQVGIAGKGPGNK